MREPLRRLTILAVLVAAACTDGSRASSPPHEKSGGEGAASAAGTPKGAADVAARGVRGFYDLGDYTVLGEVANGSGVPIYDVEVDIVYRDAAGGVLGTEEGGVVLSRIEPGAAAPFADTRYGAPEGIQQAAATVRRFSTRSGVEYRPVTIVRATAVPGVSGVVVSGQGRNDAGRPLSAIRVAAWFRNAAGEVTSLFVEHPVIGSLAPGQTFDFTIETIDSTIAGDRLVVRGEGMVEP